MSSSTAAAAPSKKDADGAGGDVHARLFDADRTDRQLGFDDAIKTRLGSRQLLWIDVVGELEAEQGRALAERFKLEADTAGALTRGRGGPGLELHGRHFHLRVVAEPDVRQPDELPWLDIVAGPNVVITRHGKPLDFLAALNEQIAADATIGVLASAEFVGAVLDAVVTTYHAAIDRIEDELDAHDARALRGSRADDSLGNLVEIRRRVGRLRRLLAAHRDVFATLVRPDFARGIVSDDPGVFQPASTRFDGALAAAEVARELVVSSFDVLMTRTAQRTNEVMRALTLVTVLGLPATITAGFLGMNVIVPVPKDDPSSFWLIAGVVVLFEIVLVVLARLKRWI
jgi:Mg2+ and Co2+ transporter CorA